MKTGNLDGQGIAELRNYNVQNLSTAPSTNLYPGRFYFNTIDNTLYVWNGTEWIDGLSQGDYTFKNGVELVDDTRDVQIKLATGSNAGNVDLTANANGLSANMDYATTEKAGVIEIATDSEASTGTSETVAVNPKQLKTKVDKNADITASTTGKTVITYDAKGLVTGGSEIGIKSNSTNYLTFDTADHKIGAKVDTEVTANSTNLVTSGAVQSAIALAQTGALKYQTTWVATNQTNYSSITLPVQKGYMYPVSGSTTIDGVEWNSGDYLVINKDIAASGAITSADVDKIDNTEASDIVRLNATQTLTNKTINADNNTISNLETDNFKTGVVQTTIRSTSTASDTALASEKAIAKALAAKVYNATNPALTVTSGLCTWTVTHNLNNSNVSVSVYEVSSGEKVMYDCAITSANVVTIKILSAANIAAGTYKVVILG